MTIKDVVGYYALPATPSEVHGFLLHQGVFTTIDFPGTIATFVKDINISHRSFGFRSAQYFIAAIYHCCARLPLPSEC